MPLVQEFYTSDQFFEYLIDRVNTDLKVCVQSDGEAEYLNLIANTFHLLNRYKYEDYIHKDWMNGIEKILNSFKACSDNNLQSESMKNFLASLSSYLIEEAPDHDCKPKAVQELCERLFPTFFVKA